MGPQWAVYPDGAGPDVAIIYDHDDHTKANARLIAAAPELLEACRMAQVRLFMLDGRNEEYLQAGAAIAKAEGTHDG